MHSHYWYNEDATDADVAVVADAIHTTTRFAAAFVYSVKIQTCIYIID